MAVVMATASEVVMTLLTVVATNAPVAEDEAEVAEVAIPFGVAFISADISSPAEPSNSRPLPRGLYYSLYFDFTSFFFQQTTHA
jgi:hypothetical protein